jgi:hypothetical protein
MNVNNISSFSPGSKTTPLFERNSSQNIAFLQSIQAQRENTIRIPDPFLKLCGPQSSNGNNNGCAQLLGTENGQDIYSINGTKIIVPQGTSSRVVENIATPTTSHKLNYLA